MTLNPRTQATLKALEDAEWFSAVGREVEGPFVCVPSWGEAFRWCGSAYWDGLLLEAANRYSEKVAGASPERFGTWNSVALEVRKHVLPLVKRKVEPVTLAVNPPAAFERAVRWDMIHVCMEAEFADVYPPGFFASQAFWYVEGHFPCGWDGEFPEGKLVLY